MESRLAATRNRWRMASRPSWWYRCGARDSGSTFRVLAQEVDHLGSRVRLIAGGHGDFHAVAGGEDERLADPALDFSSRKASASERSSKASRSRTSTGAVLWFTPVIENLIGRNRLRSPTCAAQVRAEHPTTAIAM